MFRCDEEYIVDLGRLAKELQIRRLCPRLMVLITSTDILVMERKALLTVEAKNDLDQGKRICD